MRLFRINRFLCKTKNFIAYKSDRGRLSAASQCRLHFTSSPGMSVTEEKCSSSGTRISFLTDRTRCIRNVPLIALAHVADSLPRRFSQYEISVSHIGKTYSKSTFLRKFIIVEVY